MITSWDALYVARQRPGSDVTSSEPSSSSGQPGPPPPAASAPGGPGATRPHPLPAPASDGDGAKRSRPPHAADRGPEASSSEECAEEVPSPHLPTAGTLIATAPKASPPAVASKAPPAPKARPLPPLPPPPATAEAPATPVIGGSPREPAQDAPSADAICEGEAVSAVTAKAMPLYRWTRYAPDQDRAPRFSAQRIITPAGSAPPHCPMPTRPAPMRISLAFEIDPTQEVDWTAARDQHDERSLQSVRDYMIRDMLQSNRPVQYRSSGNSLWPMVRSGDVTMWEPVTDVSTLVVGDVVFCCVQPSGIFYGHMIHKIGTWEGALFWQIGNMKDPPRINGWCLAEHIYGRLMECSPVQPDASLIQANSC